MAAGEPGRGEGPRGPGVREYAVIIAVILVIGGLALALFGGETSAVLSNVSPRI